MAQLLAVMVPGGHDVMLYEKQDHAPASYTVLNFYVSDIDQAVDASLRRAGSGSSAIPTTSRPTTRASSAREAWPGFKRTRPGNVLSVPADAPV